MGRFLTALILCAAPAVYAGDSGIRPPAEGYVLHCSGCHGLDGHGVPGTVPTLHGVGRFGSTPEGRAYLASVPGVAQAPIGDAELATLLNWVLESYSDAPPTPPYSAEEVGRFRSKPILDTTSARAALTAP
ncbi:MAG: cytochrome c [bacterium]|nr:cytochrome c [bacterium]MCP5067691.1 cytochrome c [bacterium]